MKILLAVDGSIFSEAATQVLATRIRPQDADVLIVHVIEPPAFFDQDASVVQRCKQAETLMTGSARALHSAGFKSVNTRVVEAETRTGILEVAAQWPADLIVLGSHGRKGLQKLMLGSVAESVARHASCSVSIVRIPSKSQN